MATGVKNTKSQMTTVRIPHGVVDDIEQLKGPGESTTSFLVTAAKGEIKRRQRRKAKEQEQLINAGRPKKIISIVPPAKFFAFRMT